MTSEAFVGEIRMVGFNWVPQGWASCDGQLLPISSHQALYSLLGTTYGGDGRSTFGLPDLRGRVPIGDGQGPGLAYFVQTGQRWGGGDGAAYGNQGSPVPVPGMLGINFIICLSGIYPSRS